MKSDKLIKILLGFIIVLALVLRVYKIDTVPPSISWDEASVGYNAWTIANYGRDEYDKLLPAFFRSFGDDKHPVHIYATAAFVKLLGLSEFSTRLPSAVFGVLSVVMIFLLADVMFESKYIALIAAFFLAVSPWDIHFSRFNHELNFAMFFFLLGLTLFYYGIKKRNFLLPLSSIGFGLSVLSYHSSIVVVPLMLLILLILYHRELLSVWKLSLGAIAIGFLFIWMIIANPSLLGTARIEQNVFSNDRLEQTKLYPLTKNKHLAWLEITNQQYWWHFRTDFLFTRGDKNPILSSQTGEFYPVDGLFFILGLVYLIFKRSRAGIVLLFWALVAPLPSALVAEAPHAARALYMIASWNLIAALGCYGLIFAIKRQLIKKLTIGLIVVVIMFSLWSYLSYYYGEYATRYAINWVYGMKQIVAYVKQHPEYEQVYMINIRSQPYIFFLYYLKTPLPDYLNSVIYNNNIQTESFSTVTTFGRYYFEGWDPIESFPRQDILYIVTPSQYDGLRHKALFHVKKRIDYPNGLVAFYLVSVN